MNISILKKEAEKRAKKLGHELRKWKYSAFGGRRKHHAHCNLCHDYVCIDKDSSQAWGTAIDLRPVRIGNDIVRKICRCSGIKYRTEYRRKHTRERKRILKAFKQGGINQVIHETLGDYPK